MCLIDLNNEKHCSLIQLIEYFFGKSEETYEYEPVYTSVRGEVYLRFQIWSLARVYRNSLGSQKHRTYFLIHDMTDADVSI